MERLEQTYLEIHAADLLKQAGLTKTELAVKLCVKPQNVNKLLATNNVHTLTKMAEILGVSLQYLLYGPSAIDAELNGFVEYGGKIYRIKRKEDIETLLSMIPA